MAMFFSINYFQFWPLSLLISNEKPQVQEKNLDPPYVHVQLSGFRKGFPTFLKSVPGACRT